MHRRTSLVSLALTVTLLAGCAAPQASAPPTNTTAPAATTQPAATVASSPAVAPSPAMSPAALPAPPAALPASPAAVAASPVSSPAASAASSPATLPSPSPEAASRSMVPGDTTPRVVAAAEAFLATLNESQRGQAVFEFSNTAAKAQWSNLPRGLFQWSGVRMGDLSQAQQETVHDLLRVTLSQHGYQRVMAGVAADETLKSESGANPLQFGRDNYFVAVFGTPSATAPWMFRFGGHHMTVNATVAGPNIALTPSFPGCQPCEFSANGQTVRPVGDVSTKAFALIGALDAGQRQQAVLGAQAIDLVLGANQQMRNVAPEGLRASALNAEQQRLLLDLVGEYVGLVNDEDAAVKMAEVQSGLAETYLAWYGDTTAGSASYFRIQGPTLWIEFSPQGGGGPGGGGLGLGGAATTNHVHTIYRDPTNEYGAKWTGQ